MPRDGPGARRRRSEGEGTRGLIGWVGSGERAGSVLELVSVHFSDGPVRPGPGYSRALAPDLSATSMC